MKNEVQRAPSTEESALEHAGVAVKPCKQSWWLRPSKIPNAPGWAPVCLLGAVWNAVVNRSLFGTLFCVGLLVFLRIVDALVEHVVKNAE
jgi:hypothetical protein